MIEIIIITNVFLQLFTHILNLYRKSVFFCDENHSANKSSKITDPHARKSFLAGNGRCFICFQNKHLASACKPNYKCHKCNGRHHISICTFSCQRTNNSPVNQGDGTLLVQPQPTPTPVPPQAQQPPTSTTTNFSRNKNNVLLQTATTNVSNLTRNPISEDVQIIFDSGSQRTYVSDSLRKRLKL